MRIDVTTRNARMDGLRGLCIVLVLLGHLTFYRIGSVGPDVAIAELLARPEVDAALWIANLYRVLARDLLQALAGVGVEVFFVISGFLITALLHAEEERTGRINVAAFYIRRACRILPAFYVLLLVTIALGAFGVIRLPDGAALRSGLFACNLPGVACSWWLDHTWSLAVEEQFYLAWPWVFLLAPRGRTWLTVGLSVLLPVAGMWVPALSAFACIAVGAALALRPEIQAAAVRHATAARVWASIAIILVAPVTSLWRGGQVAHQMLTPWLLGFIVLATLAGVGPLHALVRLRALQAIGVVSYSLYLWQQLSLAPRMYEGTEILGEPYLQAGPVTAMLFLVPALLSYALLERPFRALGRRLSAAITRRETETRSTARPEQPQR